MPNKRFYSDQLGSFSQYTTTPTNALDVARLLRHLPAWKISTEASVKKKKTLVINTALLLKLSHDNRDNSAYIFHERIERLFQQGFDIYACLNGLHLEKLTQNNFSDLINEQTYIQMEDSPPEAQLKTYAAKQLGLTHDELFVFNAQTLEECIEGDEEDYLDFIHDHELNLKDSNISTASLNTLLNLRKDAVTSLCLDGCLNLRRGDLTPGLKLPLLNTLNLGRETLENGISKNKSTYERPSSLSIKCIKNLIESTDQLRELNLSYFKKLDRRILDSIKNPALLEVLKLENFHNLDENSIRTLLKSTPKLKYLDLSGCRSLSPETFKDLHLKELEVLKLDEVKIDSNSLNQILKETYKLNTLIVHSLKKLKPTAFQDFDSSFLKILELPFSKLDLASLGMVLKPASKLKKLNLKSCKNLSGILPEDLKLPELIDLNLYGTQINSQLISQLIKHSPKLMVLNLNSVKLTGSLPEELHLNSLKILYLGESQFDEEFFNRLLKHASKLKGLSLYGTEIPEFVSNLNLNSLEMLYLLGASISTASLDKFLLQTPQLKELNLAYCTTLSGVLSQNLNLNFLENLDLGLSTINTQSLDALLKHASSLKNLNLTRCEKLIGTLSKDLKLGSLEKLVASASTMNTASLVNLLKHATQLKTLDLRGCKDILGVGVIPDLPLGSLEVLHLENSTVNSGFLVKLLKNASKLTKLHLRGCPNEFSELLDLNLNSLQLLELSGTKITTEVLIKLLKQTPNLRDLDIKSCPNIDYEALKPHLKSSITVLRDDTPSKPFNDIIGKVDADTHSSSTQFHVKQLFFATHSGLDPQISLYRKNTFQKLTLNPNKCPISDAFEISSYPQDKQLNELPVTRSAEDTWNSMPSVLDPKKPIYYSKQTIASHNEWQPLASLSPQEEMLLYHLSDPKASIHIAYSQRDNLYYVKNDSGTELTLDFQVRVPASLPTSKLPADVQIKIKDCLNFGEKALKLESDTLTGAEYLQALAKQKVGACRHRAIVFKVWMEEHHPDIPVRIITNGCHAFVEVKWQDAWITCNLGGYAAELKIDRTNTPQSSKRPQTSAITVPLLPYGETSISSSNKKTYFPPRTQQAVPNTRAEYVQSLCTSGSKKLLIELDDETILNALNYGIQSFAHHTSRPCFYVNSPEELICSSAYVLKEGDQGRPQPGPGGRLYNFLMQHQEDEPIILVNYAQFTPRDIVRFNALIDEERLADGTPLPPKARVIGLINPHAPNAYQGSDFYSRFDEVQKCPLKSNEFTPAKAPPEHAKFPGTEAEVVEFFGGAAWEEQVFGSWRLHGNALHFMEGDLIKALKKNKSVELSNAPWDNPDFLHFWEETMLFQEIRGPYETTPLPEGHQFTQSQGYDWAQLKTHLSMVDTIPEDALALNPTLLSEWFSRYECDNAKKTLTTVPGLIEHHKGAVIHAYLTAPLSEAAWARLLDFCNHHHKRLSLACAPGVTLPKNLDMAKHKPSTVTAWNATTLPQGDFAVASTDLDLTLTQIKADVVLDISEVNSSHLLKNMQVEVDPKTLALAFEEETGALIHALDEGKTVVLKGEFKAELQDRLMPLLLKRRTNPAGRLILVSSKELCAGLMPQLKHEVQILDKKRGWKHSTLIVLMRMSIKIIL